MSVTDHVQNRTGETMWSREHFFTSLFLSAATSHSLQPCTDVLKGFYLVWNRRAEKRTDFSGKTARRLLTLLYIRPFVCSVYISIPPYPPRLPHSPPCLLGRIHSIRFRCLWLPAVNPPGLIKVTGAGTVNHGRSKTWEPAGKWGPSALHPITLYD